MKNTIIIFAVLLSFSQLSAQKNIVYSTLDKTIRKSDYEDIKGTPYLFDDWATADVYFVDQDPIKDALIKFDLYSGDIELKENDKDIVMNENFVKKIVISRDKNKTQFKKEEVDSIILAKGMHRDYIKKFGIILFKGKRISLLKDINILFKESKYNTPGKTEIIKKFKKQKSYSLLIDKELHSIKLKDKEFYKKLGKQSEFKAYLKKEKMKLKKEGDFVKLLSFYETLIDDKDISKGK